MMRRPLFIAGMTLAFFMFCLLAVNARHKSLLNSRHKLPAAGRALKTAEALAFCRAQKMDTTLAFFVDMSIHSGKKRFFIVDLQKATVLSSGLCCHGMGMGSTGETPVFSNENGSYCTSPGKYKTGARAYSQWGIHVHYKLNGLESTNSNAFKRIVVLHSYEPVPEEEIYPEHLPMGWSLGCPVISNQMMTAVDGLLKARKKPVLLWIYR